MGEFVLICLLVAAVLILIRCTDRKDEECERLRAKLNAERCRCRTYARHSTEMYDRFIREQRTSNLRGAVITAYKERCGD